MRARYKSPTGTGILEVVDNATVETLFDEMRKQTGIYSFTLRYGSPLAMKSITYRQKDETVKSLGLHGETLTIVPDEQRPLSPMEQPGIQNSSSSRAVRSDKPEDITVPWPEREGTVCKLKAHGTLLRVMPSDNSCLFTAFGGALPKQIPAHQLRRMMADYINAHPDVYSEAILGTSRAAYCRSIQDPDRWGGGIELSILSSIFDIQICTYDVQVQKLIQFGELKKDRCILVFSGIHYDRVAFSFSEYPHNQVTLPPEMDRTIWPIDDDEILNRTQALVQKLHAAHYYTDTEGLILKCDVQGCNWIGNGQIAGRKHAEQTGHVELSEIHDTDDDNILRKCEMSGCEFIGQGDRVMRQHSGDTGHERFSIIPDI
ncbi:Ubiquitin thioesterase OTU1-like protein [Cladobotryum mycophilum]|uniref:Ubiquitin thioesterase OTU n=1 Tax=Cladobotryum mycophilum TaxID=491253 RepID=A0ABR0SN01_9HYPO